MARSNHSDSQNLIRTIRRLGFQAFLVAAITLVLAFFTGVPSFAQSGLSTVLGTVTDQSGAVVRGATVTIRNDGTNISVVQKTNADGEYVFPNLIPGTYTVTVQQSGFQQFSITNLVLQVDQTVRENAALAVGRSVSSVQVSAKAPIVQTDTSSVGSVISTKQIAAMPLNGRTNIFGLLALAPGVQGSGVAPMIGGATTLGSYNETIDGTNALEPENSYLGSGIPSLDSISQFRVVDSTGSAKYGSGFAAIVITTKSGTNHFHGSLFEYNRVAALDAKDYFATNLPKPPFVRNEFGGSLGGPIKRNKIFFFGSFEGLTFRSSSTREGAMPTEALLKGDFSGLPTIIDPDTGQPFPNNQIPSGRISPVAKNLFPYFDSPNLGSSSPAGLGTNWVGNVGSAQNDMRYEGRVDYNINGSNQVFGRYFMDRISPNIIAGTTDKWGTIHEPTTWQNYSFHYTHTFSPTLINASSFGYQRVSDRNASENEDVDASKLIPGLTPPIQGLGGLPVVSIIGFTGLGDWAGSGDLEQTFQGSDNLTWTTGKHLIEAGFSFMHWKFYNFQNPGLGSFSFTGLYTGNPFADFLLGDLAGSNRPIAPLSATPTNDRYGFYVQDDWKVAPTLTLNLGLRYDLPTIFENTQGNMANWYPDTNQLVILKGEGDTSLFPGIPFVQGSKVGLGPGNYIGADHTQVAPRFGFAYRPLKTSKFVVRGGYGLYYNQMPWAFGSYELAVNAPFTGTQTFEPLAGSTPSLTFANAFPVNQGGIPSGISASAYPKHYKYPMSGEWNLTLESQVSSEMAVRATYLGQETEHLTSNFGINTPVPAPGPVQPRRPFQPFGPINFFDNILTANTQSLQLAAVRRFSNGLSFEGQYAWTKMLDAGVSLYGPSPTDPQDIGYDRGNDSSIRHQYFVGNYVYELPFGRGRHFLSHLDRVSDAILGGWQTSGILTLGSGLPYSVTFSSAVEGWPSNRADRVGDPHISSPTIQRWFNPAAFAVPTAFTYGNSARNSLFGPHFTNWDTSVSKHFVYRERYNLSFQADFFNALNHPNFNRPHGDISVPSQVGQITSDAGPRNIEFALRLDF